MAFSLMGCQENASCDQTTSPAARCASLSPPFPSDLGGMGSYRTYSRTQLSYFERFERASGKKVERRGGVGNWSPLRPEMLYIEIEGALVLLNTKVM